MLRRPLPDPGSRQQLALMALSLVEGTMRDDGAAEDLLVDAFDSVEQAAVAHAYLAGFVLQLLIEARPGPPELTVRLVRDILRHVD